jgi:CRP/FNR family cyclic AMP-dependent transcriptional regulator
MGFTVKINGTDHRGDVDGETPLLCLLRDALGTTGVRENRCWRSTIAPPASKVEVQILIPPEFFDQIAGSPETARELQRRPDENWQGTDSQTVESAVNSAYISAKNPWLQSQFHTPFGLGDLPFVVGRRPLAGEEQPPYQPELKLDDTVPFRLSRNHFMIEKRDGHYHVRDLYSTLGTIVNGEPIGDHCRAKDALLRAGDNEVIAGGLNSPFVFSVLLGWRGPRQLLASTPTRRRPGPQPHALARGRA